MQRSPTLTPNNTFTQFEGLKERSLQLKTNTVVLTYCELFYDQHLITKFDVFLLLGKLNVLILLNTFFFITFYVCVLKI